MRRRTRGKRWQNVSFYLRVCRPQKEKNAGESILSTEIFLTIHINTKFIMLCGGCDRISCAHSKFVSHYAADDDWPGEHGISATACNNRSAERTLRDSALMYWVYEHLKWENDTSRRLALEGYSLSHFHFAVFALSLPLLFHVLRYCWWRAYPSSFRPWRVIRPNDFLLWVSCGTWEPAERTKNRMSGHENKREESVRLFSLSRIITASDKGGRAVRIISIGCHCRCCDGKAEGIETER